MKVILAGLEAYGQMWDGIKMMAGKLDLVLSCLLHRGFALTTIFNDFSGEVRAALEAATRLPEDIAHEE